MPEKKKKKLIILPKGEKVKPKPKKKVKLNIVDKRKQPKKGSIADLKKARKGKKVNMAKKPVPKDTTFYHSGNTPRHHRDYIKQQQGVNLGSIGEDDSFLQEGGSPESGLFTLRPSQSFMKRFGHKAFANEGFAPGRHNIHQIHDSYGEIRAGMGYGDDMEMYNLDDEDDYQLNDPRFQARINHGFAWS